MGYIPEKYDMDAAEKELITRVLDGWDPEEFEQLNNESYLWGDDAGE